MVVYCARIAWGSPATPAEIERCGRCAQKIWVGVLTRRQALDVAAKKKSSRVEYVCLECVSAYANQGPRRFEAPSLDVYREMLNVIPPHRRAEFRKSLDDFIRASGGRPPEES